uniref:Uncharacterized protein MANES_09G167800 n=1 Tax=Rhizophora mucronata TaxID=61149 RepID=A0A2P2IQ25_RHIMU
MRFPLLGFTGRRPLAKRLAYMFMGLFLIYTCHVQIYQLIQIKMGMRTPIQCLLPLRKH